MSNCTNCGYALAADDAFCASCGHAQPPAAPATVPAWARSEPATAGGNGNTALGRSPDAPRGAGATYQESRPASAPQPSAAPPSAFPPSAAPRSAVPPSAPQSSAPQPSAPQPSVFQIAADTVGLPPGAETGAGRRADESIERRYMRQTRTATVFIAVMVGIWSALLTILIIYTVVKVNDVNNALNNGISNLGNSNCLSQGGTDPSC